MMHKMTTAKANDEWELRPSGMLVQKRISNSESSMKEAPSATIRVKVKYESEYYEIYLSSQSTFGQLRKMIAERTGVPAEEQTVIYREKERKKHEFLDRCGVKNRSKLVMAVDVVARAKKVIESQRLARVQKADKIVKDVSIEVDQLALKVSDMEKSILKRDEVTDNDILNLTEQLMAQMVKLDDIVANTDIKVQMDMQVRKIQKNVETLDALKIKVKLLQKYQHQHQQKQKRNPQSSAMLRKEQEMFDSLFAS